MRRFASAPPAIVLAVLLFAAACGGGSGDEVVATVSGVEIHRSDVVELRTVPDDEVVLDSSDFRNELMFMIAQQALVAALESEFGVQVSEAEVTAAIEANMAATGLSVEQLVDRLEEPAATEARLERIVLSQLLRERGQLAVAGSAELLDDVFANRLDLVTTVCVRHVLVATADEAAAVQARLVAGESLATVADELSLDAATPGGDLGCAVAARYVAPFAAATLDAPIGEVVDPVETEFGWHVLVVDRREAPTRAEVEEMPQAYLAAATLQSEFTRWFNEQLRAADIEVSAAVGTWFAAGPGILPRDAEPTEE